MEAIECFWTVLVSGACAILRQAYGCWDILHPSFSKMVVSSPVPGGASRQWRKARHCSNFHALHMLCLLRCCRGFCAGLPDPQARPIIGPISSRKQTRRCSKQHHPASTCWETISNIIISPSAAAPAAASSSAYRRHWCHGVYHDLGMGALTNG